MLGIARGIVLVITDAKTVQGLPEAFQKIANGTILGIPNLLIIAALVTAAIAGSCSPGRSSAATSTPSARTPSRPGSPACRYAW